MAEAKIQLERLNNFNWASWKFRMELLLVQDGLQDVMSEQKPDKPPADWMKRDGKARAIIGLALENDQLCHVMGVTTAYEMWKALKGYHERDSLTNKVYVFRKLCSLKLEEGGSMAEHLMVVAELVHRLVALGEGLAEHWIVAIILSSLTASYDALESRPVEELKQDYVKGKLLDEWKRKSENVDSDKALKVSTRGRYEVRGSRSDGRGDGNSAYPRRNHNNDKRNCYCCKQWGHFWRECPKLSLSDNDDEDDDEEEEEAKVSVQRKTKRDGNICFNATGGGEFSAKQPKNDDWYLDSGCMMHLTGRADLLEGRVACREEIILADGRKILATAMGTGRLKVKRGNGEHHVIPIRRVLFVPGLSVNLLSVGRMAERGFDVMFRSNECKIMKGDKLIAMGERKDGLYVVR